MYLDDAADKVIDIRLVPCKLARISVRPEAEPLRLTNQLSLLELSVVVSVKVGVFWRA